VGADVSEDRMPSPSSQGRNVGELLLGYTAPHVRR
jgi:hypothetical protein